jgi:MHS family alpha-ketoglutarate permease-like MFS transporter
MNSQNTKIDPEYTSAEVRERIFSIIAASSGNLVEWFDFYIFAFCAVYFAPQFFPKADQTVQLLNTAGIFAAGFLMRPIGGWIFGRIADKKGRKHSMVVSVVLMCVGSLAIAVCPTYSSVGIFAPLILLIARLFQGLSVGGEYGATATYMSEVAIKGRRGFFSSFQYVTLIGGQLLAVLVVVALQAAMTEESLKEWGWRIPFVIGAITSVVALKLRSALKETTTKNSRDHEDAGSVKALLTKHLRPFLTVLGYTAGGSLIFYTFTTYMQKYLINTAGYSIKSASAIMTTCLFLFMLMQPLFGALSDKIGRRNNMLLFSSLGVLMVLPVMITLETMADPIISGLLICIALAVVSLYTSISGIVKAEMFPIEVRALGVGLSYAIGNALFGGSAEFVALNFKAAGHESGFFWYVTIIMAFVFLISWRLPKTPEYLAKEL